MTASQQGSTRDRLVEAAADVFAESGYEGSRVHEIARRAGLTTGAIYANFNGKADLLLAAIGTATLELFSEHAAGLPAADALEGAGRRLLTTTDPERRALVVEALMAARRDPEVHAQVRARLEERERELADLIDDGRSEGSISAELDTAALARFCHALSLGFLLTEPLDLATPDSAAWAGLIRRVIASFSPDADAASRKEAASYADS